MQADREKVGTEDTFRLEIVVANAPDGAVLQLPAADRLRGARPQPVDADELLAGRRRRGGHHPGAEAHLDPAGEPHRHRSPFPRRRLQTATDQYKSQSVRIEVVRGRLQPDRPPPRATRPNPFGIPPGFFGDDDPLAGLDLRRAHGAPRRLGSVRAHLARQERGLRGRAGDAQHPPLLAGGLELGRRRHHAQARWLLEPGLQGAHQPHLDPAGDRRGALPGVPAAAEGHLPAQGGHRHHRGARGRHHHRRLLRRPQGAPERQRVHPAGAQPAAGARHVGDREVAPLARALADRGGARRAGAGEDGARGPGQPADGAAASAGGARGLQGLRPRDARHAQQLAHPRGRHPRGGVHPGAAADRHLHAARAHRAFFRPGHPALRGSARRRAHRHGAARRGRGQHRHLSRSPQRPRWAQEPADRRRPQVAAPHRRTSRRPRSAFTARALVPPGGARAAAAHPAGGRLRLRARGAGRRDARLASRRSRPAPRASAWPRPRSCSRPAPPPTSTPRSSGR